MTGLAAARSQLDEILWPAMSDGEGATLLALLHQLEDWQGQDADRLREGQYRQLGVLAAYCRDNAPAFAARLRKAGLAASSLAEPGGLQRLPPVTRSDLRRAGNAIYCRSIPQAHAPVVNLQVEDQGAAPLILQRTAVNRLFRRAHIIRDHLWHGRDFSSTLAAILPGADSGERPDWPPPASLLFRTGPSHVRAAGTPPADQMRWLKTVDPHYIMTDPATLAALLDHLEGPAGLPRLRQIGIAGRMLPASLRARAEASFNASVAWSCVLPELGAIALQCPSSGFHHVMAENLIVEILDENGHAASPGQPGQLVVTDLHNLASPLVRYATELRGSFMESCSCGRGLPLLEIERPV